MSVIDTSTWEKYQIGKLFPKIIKPKVYHTKDVQEYENGIPYVVRSKFNNGIKYLVKKTDNIEVSPSGVISFGAENANFFYQDREWCSGRDIYYIDTRELTEYSCKFVISCMRTLAEKYSYNYGLFPDLLKEEFIKLPADSTGAPDWNFMDKYMRNVECKAKKLIDSMKKITLQKQETIDTDMWKPFKVKDIVDKVKLKCLKEDFCKTFDVSLVRTEEFDLPLVNAKHYNNGIMYYGRECDFEHIEMSIDIVQNGASAVGDVYAQPQKTGVLEDAYLVKPVYEEISVQALFYLATVIEKCVKQYFSYDEKCTWDKVKGKDILLPVNLHGEPDYDYMKNYIIEIEKRAANTFLQLRMHI